MEARGVSSHCRSTAILSQQVEFGNQPRLPNLTIEVNGIVPQLHAKRICSCCHAVVQCNIPIVIEKKIPWGTKNKHLRCHPDRQLNACKPGVDLDFKSDPPRIIGLYCLLFVWKKLKVFFFIQLLLVVVFICISYIYSWDTSIHKFIWRTAQ